MLSKQCLFSILNLFFSFCSLSQNHISFKHIKYEDGLSNSTIECIYQDSRGFIWFGTRDGLNRYGGNHQLKIFRYESNNPNSISDNYITCMVEDSNGKLWVGTTNGLNCFDQISGKFIKYKHNNNPNSISNSYITSIIKDKNNEIWISTLEGGINQYIRKSNSFKSYRNSSSNKNSIQSNTVNCLFEDTHGKIWLGTNSGLQYFVKQNETFYTPLIANTINSSVTAISEDKSGNIIIGTMNDGLYFFNESSNSIKHLQHSKFNNTSLSSNLIKSILVTQKGNIWIGTVNGGLDLFNSINNSFFNYHYEIDNINSLSQRTVSALFEDNQENLWIGTHRGGVNLYMPKAYKFNLYQQQKNKNSISYSDIRSFCEDNSGNIWIGTDGGGLNLFNRTTKIFSKFNTKINNTTLSDEILGITQDSYGNIWLATWGDGLYLFNQSTKSFSRFQHNKNEPNSISSNFIQAIFEDSKKRLWVATYYGGLNLMDFKNKKFTRITKSASNKTALNGNNIVSINEDTKGNIWIGTDDGGLNCLQQQTGEFNHYFNYEEKKPDLRVIFIDKQGSVWVGQKGLYQYDSNTDTFLMFTNMAGLNTEFIKAIKQDNNGLFWIATSNGLTQYNIKHHTFRKYNNADGLQGIEFEANASLKTKDGELFFGGVNGFNSFYPQNIINNSFIPPVYITDFQLSEGEQISSLDKEISFVDEIKLNYQQTTFNILFTALNYTIPENNQFQYQLEAWDKSWVVANKDQKASYVNVKPGTYIFKVKASNNDGIWNDTIQKITIVITPPFWNTLWFKLLIVILIIAFIFIYFNYKQKIKTQQLEQEKKSEIHQSQLQFFTNISHEFRTPLSLIIGPIEKLINDIHPSSNKKYYTVIYRNAIRLMNLINELMDFRKAESGNLKLKVMPGNIAMFLNEIEEEFSEIAHEKNIQFKVLCDDFDYEIYFDRQILEKIIVNLLGNSFKYTNTNGFITLEATKTIQPNQQLYTNELIVENDYKTSTKLYIKVTDTGIGISKNSLPHLFERYFKVSDAHLGSGIGLAFVKTLTLLHKGNIKVYSEHNKGTEFIIEIPCAASNYIDSEKWIANKTNLNNFEFNFNELNNVDDIYTTQPNYSPTQLDKKQTILIVEDNTELRNFIKENFEKNYKVIEAENGKDGLTVAKSALPDLIISDIMMPIMNGVEFCKQLKSDVEISHIPFLMLTAKDSLTAKLEGSEAGADYYFTKPVSIQLLINTVENIFKQSKLLKEKYRYKHYTEIKEIVQSNNEKEFLEGFIEIVEQYLSNPEMDINYICKKMGISRTKLYHKIKLITGQSIGDYIRTIRLKKAAQLLIESDNSIAEIMYLVGIQTQSYFTKAFKAEFGKTPSQFLKDIQAKH